MVHRDSKFGTWGIKMGWNHGPFDHRPNVIKSRLRDVMIFGGSDTKSG